MNRADAEQLLKTALANPSAQFREGQWEAIDALVNQQQKLLVVQRTGWGKSSVYFISTKIFRDRGMGPTIIVSPLLALMRNQIESAQRLGIMAETMNSTNREEWQSVTQRILNNQVDCLLISPERLANDQFVETVLQPIADRIALMVIDEAHCISDWGHDFRPDYRRIVNILRQLPSNTPVLGTTATANNRVIQDIETQLGNIQIQRGPLIRESLALQNIVLPDQASRLAWLKQTIPQLLGTGIVYVLTQRDAELVSGWLNKNKIVARPYYSGVMHSEFIDANGRPDSDIYREHLEAMLLSNEIKVLVATTALGMGYDKPDLGFVIHYQAPGSIVSYYQQVGRAGRGIKHALGVLMSGIEDQDIHEFFRRTAFPSQEDVSKILLALENADGLTPQKLEKEANLPQKRIEHVLKFLAAENPSPVLGKGKTWFRTPVHYAMNIDHVRKISQIRLNEWENISTYLNTNSCLMNFIRVALDDHVTESCGKCMNCIGQDIVPKLISEEVAFKAVSYLKHTEEIINPRKEIAQSNDESVRTFIEYSFPRRLGNLAAQEGRVLSRWGDAGWGKQVADDKHNRHFRNELVDAVAEMICERWRPDPSPTWVCCVPSMNHPQLVQDFARRLAAKLGIPFVDAVVKAKTNQPQKGQQNRFHQCRNLDGAFAIHQPVPSGAVLLVDDIVDSGWTLTVIAALLQQAGSGVVFPVALASSSVND
jgi:ATP-dependent DNA helicase RecQ